ncbi:hypothetical protein FSP39_015840 [Pinctada imbricata]|uniref:Uncharacterized protein n=1 Tax=Pinctada imbricata TaxID=66713 RepID=A0AA89BUY6_PINIB|nr:hypothetical protein FSP39_015840 [Pinctada imbricata]
MSPRSVITDDSDDDISDLEVSFGNKEVYVIEVDDANDKSIISLLNDSVMPDGFTLFNTKKMPDQGTTTLSCNLQMFSHVWRGEFNPVSASKQTVSDLFEVIIKKICYKLRKMSPCSLCSLDFDIDLPEENELQISLTGVCCGLEAVTESISDAVFESSTVNKNHLLKMMHNVSNISGQSEGEDMMFHMEEVSSETNTGHHPGTQSSHVNHSGDQTSHSSKPRHWVEITPLSFVPGTKVERYLGNYNFFFIRETTSLREMGGLSGFMQAFIAEVLCNVRANVSALGGNGLVTYRMSQCVLLCNPHKNQSQCLINVSGDAVVLGLEEETIIVEPVRKNSTSPLPTHTS